MNIRNILLAATVLALPAAAVMAQPIDGVYVGGSLGYDWTQDVKVRGSGGESGKLKGDGGVAVQGSAGYGLGNGLRVELEGEYHGNHYRLHQNGVQSGGGNTDSYGLFANALYDFYLDLPVVPFVGAGVGYEWTHLRATGLSSTEGSLAAQAILGAALPTAVPGLALTAEYRFLATLEDIKYRSGEGNLKLEDQYNHVFLVGARYAFNAAPPPPAVAPVPAPVAAPAPAPSRTYLVFFDWDRADLTGRAKQIIAEAAQNSTRVQLTQIEVSGHADRTGTAQYNLALSRKRADNVAAELVRLGVPKNEILIQAFGDTKPLVPTAEGVREPQNRRVEIVLK
jgi:outer membrane protein OmpA-like peptidoglycan-associated protein